MKLHHTFLISTILLAGCGTTGEQWNQMFQEANSMNAGQRNYVTHPITASAPSQGVQPNLQPFGASGEEYQTVMVNTPNGIVYKRCKVVNGQNVACF